MATIRIKRGSGTPSSLAAGELALDTATNAVWVGNGTGIVTVGSSRLGAIAGDLDTVLDQSICLATYLDGSASDVSLAARTQSGTCLVRLRRNSTSLGNGTTSVAANSRAVVDYSSASLIAGDELWLDITSTSNVVGFRFSVWFDAPTQVGVP